MSKTVRHFGSMREFVTYCAGDTDYTGTRRSRDKRDPDWFESDTYEQCEGIAFRWDEGAEQVDAMAGRISLGIERVKRQAMRTYAAPGTLLIGAYVNDHPRPYMVRRPTGEVEKGRGKVVRIVFNIAASGGIEASVLRRRGAAVLALVEALEKKGQRCELVAVCGLGAQWGREGSAEYWVTVKRATTRLNLNSVAFAFAHPSMLRRFIFSAMERENEEFRKAFMVGFGYGMPRDVTPARGDIYVGRAMYGETQWESDAAATEWVRQTLIERGVLKPEG